MSFSRRRWRGTRDARPLRAAGRFRETARADASGSTCVRSNSSRSRFATGMKRPRLYLRGVGAAVLGRCGDVFGDRNRTWSRLSGRGSSCETHAISRHSSDSPAAVGAHESREVDAAALFFFDELQPRFEPFDAAHQAAAARAFVRRPVAVAPRSDS